MKKPIMLALAAMLGISAAQAESITIGETTYDIVRLIDRQVGPGINYTRMRLPEYPLNVNVLTVDLNNPYNRIETTVGREASRGTELLVDAAARQSYDGHRVVGGANANFWYVGTQTQGPVFQGISIGASVRNGKIITETNQHRDQFDMGSLSTGIVGIDYDKLLHIAPCTSAIKLTSSHFGSVDVHQCNKGVWEDELSMYNSHYGANISFQPLSIDTNNGNKYCIAQGLTDVTEVVLDFDEGETWTTARDLTFVVKEVRTATNGLGTIGEHDLALVGRGNNSALLAQLAEGEKVTLNYSWTFDPGLASEVTPAIENAVGGNAIIMYNGELRSENYTHGYCSMVYSRTGYGCSADGKTLYIVVIDKSTDSVYGTSVGCTTDVMCLLAKQLGCVHMANLDAGGSAQMFVTDRIVNKTTEGSPRQVNNGWFIYSLAPDDDTEVASLAFYDYELSQGVLTSASPRVIAYNKYGAVIDFDYKDFTLSVSEGGGTCHNNVFVAGTTPGVATLTAHVGDVTVSRDIEILPVNSITLRPTVLIDSHRRFSIDATATTDKGTNVYDPTHISWTVADPTVADIDEAGCLYGIKNGTTTVTGSIAGENLTMDVTVEIPSANVMNSFKADSWTVKGAAGMQNTAIDETGLVTFSFTNRRTGSVDFSNGKLPFYSLPDKIYTEFNCPIPITSISVDFYTNGAPRPTSARMVPVEGEAWAADTDHHVELALDTVFDTSDIGIYPITFSRMRYTFQNLPTNQGDQALHFGGVWGVYDNYNSITDVTAGDEHSRVVVAPNPVEAGMAVTVVAEAVAAVDLYTSTGRFAAHYDIAPGEAPTFAAPTTPGIYVARVTTAKTAASSILIVK